MAVPWGPWRPDVGGPNTGMAVTADGVVPQSAGTGIGYGPLNAQVIPSGAVSLGANPQGLITIQRTDGGWQDYVATSTKIRLLTSAYDWTDIETGRTVTTDDDVSFALYGNYLLNADTTDGFKAYNYESGGTNDAVTGNGAPTAVRSICVCNNVVFLLDCDGNNRRMESSAQGDHTEYRTGGADGKTFEDGGALFGMRDLRNGLGVIFQESAIRLVQFGAAPEGALYTINKVADGLGAASDRAISPAYNGRVWFVANGGGLYEYAAGGEPVPIGDQKVNAWLAGQVAAEDLGTIQVATDPSRKMTWFRINATTLLGYHWTIREFVTASVATTALLRLATPAVLIDDLVGLIDDQTATIDSLDFQGGAPAFGSLGSDLKVNRFTGTPIAADLRTCTISAGGSRRFLEATPQSDNTASTLTIYTSDNLAVSASAGTAATRNSDDGIVRLDDRGRYFAFREQHAAGDTWTYSNGVDDIQSNPDAP